VEDRPREEDPHLSGGSPTVSQELSEIIRPKFLEISGLKQAVNAGGGMTYGFWNPFFL